MTSPVSDEAGGRHPLRSVGRLVARPLLWLIRGYQLLISPLTPPSCRYYPSCSAYALTAIERHGPIRGSWLALRRLGRCHPWSAGGVDHVPPLPGHAPDDHRLAEDRDPSGPGTIEPGGSSNTPAADGATPTIPPPAPPLPAAAS